MRRFVPLMLLPLAAACAAEGSHGKVSREVAAVVQEEDARAKVVDAAQKGATTTQAMDKVADGPKREKPGPE
jgi:hypothetical protein